MISWLGNLHIRHVGSSLLARTVVTVAAFTMTTCLLLGLFSMAAVGATRSIVGGGAPPEAAEVSSGDGDDSEAAKGSGSKTPASKTPASKARRAGAGRPGGAAAPADALRGAGRDEEEGGS